MPNLVSTGATIMSPTKDPKISEKEYEQESLEEAAMKAKYRNALDDKSFGLPDKRAYPLNDEKHVRSAISMFSHCPEEDRSRLAKNIFSAARKFDMDLTVSPDSTIYEYAPEEFKAKSQNEAATEDDGTPKKKSLAQEFKDGYREGYDKGTAKAQELIDKLKNSKRKCSDGDGDDNC